MEKTPKNPESGFDPDEPTECNNCGWQGLIKETKKQSYESSPEDWLALAGREGYHYFCPNCDSLVAHFYWKMS